MGRKKSTTKKISNRKKQVVATIFKCPFCAHDDAVECKMDRDSQIGSVSCRVCNAAFQTQIHYLSEPIDVYTDWVDACEEEAEAAAGNVVHQGGLSDDED